MLAATDHQLEQVSLWVIKKLSKKQGRRIMHRPRDGMTRLI
jgi:hypothetical protein